ncbi:hypothetical protein GOODEAATRI_009519 [Goodea atripinnis]|uniref:Uncharacterized protein n=1 Tax=Goodea atripinnis TaxID=208336 RepID=A0ABV0NCH7_9TELE
MALSDVILGTLRYFLNFICLLLSCLSLSSSFNLHLSLFLSYFLSWSVSHFYPSLPHSIPPSPLPLFPSVIISGTTSAKRATPDSSASSLKVYRQSIKVSDYTG